MPKSSIAMLTPSSCNSWRMASVPAELFKRTVSVISSSNLVEGKPELRRALRTVSTILLLRS